MIITSHPVYFPSDNAGGHEPVGYDVRVIGPSSSDGEGFMVVEFADGDRESVPTADLFDCDDVTCLDPTHG